MGTGYPFKAIPDTEIQWNLDVKAMPGDTIVTSLWQMDENQDPVQIGTTIHYAIREGAPFTFGRALGLGDEPMKKAHSYTLMERPCLTGC